MADVARAAGVSAMTVSRALRNDPRQRPATCRRIREIAEKMNYRPNPLVSIFNANTRHSRRLPLHATIGLLNCRVDSAKDQGHAFAVGVHRRAAEFGYRVDDFHCGNTELPMAKWENVFRSRGLAGLIFLPMGQPHARCEFDLSGYACAAVGYTLEAPDLHRAVHNHFSGLRLAVSTLLKRGYRRIGFVDEMVHQERIRRLHLAAHLTEDYPCQIPPFRLESTMSEANDKAFRAWFRRYRPDVLLTAEYGLRTLLDRLGVAVPGDVALASVDAGPSRAIQTGIDQMAELVGAGAFDLVLAQLHRNERGVPAQPKVMLTGGRWADGDGTVPPRVGD